MLGVAMSPAASRAVELKDIELRGIIREDPRTIAYLLLSDGRGKWCAEGDVIGVYTLRTIHLEANEAVVEAAGRPSRQTLSLVKPSPGEAKASPTGHGAGKLLPAADLDWSWIRSEANPMRKAPEPLPDWVALEWARIDDAVRKDFQNFSRRHGWELVRVLALPNGRIRQSISPLRNPAEPALSSDERRKVGVPAALTR